MGIPKFFRWLSRRYPMILQNVRRESECPPSDNLYLDLNSIVHNVIHGNDEVRHAQISQLKDFEEVWAQIMIAIDEIVHMVKPRKFILLALDGVAPRAKMNQQRARRFEKARAAGLKKEEQQAKGIASVDLFDSNQISPGTEFMYNLGKKLEWFVKYKLNCDPLYQKCDRVVVSDSSVPGEGEHKMMDYIRNLKLEPGYDPNTRHCFYGSDADLIMLSLLTHEPHFMIIREEHKKKRPPPKGAAKRPEVRSSPDLQLIHISVLREYFLFEYRECATKMKLRFDIERIIDDFVFFCFFIGNDFLPALSALDIAEGALEHLIAGYKGLLPTMTDYITDQGVIHWDRAAPFIALLAAHEDANLQKSNFDGSIPNQDQPKRRGPRNYKEPENKAEKALKQRKVEKAAQYFIENTQKSHKKQLVLKKYAEDNQLQADPSIRQKYVDLHKAQQAGETEKTTQALTEDQGLHSIIEAIHPDYFSDLNADDIPDSEVKEPEESKTSDVPKEPVVKAQTKEDLAVERNREFMSDFVQVYKQDTEKAKARYYQSKLKFDVHSEAGKKQLHTMLYRYLEGLQWVLLYYYRGAQHWRWFYPYHYAPMISDLGFNIVSEYLGGETVIREFKTDVHCTENPKPYTPFQQLLCILPIKSLRAFVPKPYVQLAEGVLKEYFPDDFEIDLNGRTLAWEALILIPFADEQFFIAEEAKLGLEMKGQELERNTVSFVYPSFSFDESKAKEKDRDSWVPLKSALGSMKDIQNDCSVEQKHEDYERVGAVGFSAKLLPGVRCPQPDFPSLNWLAVQCLEFVDKEQWGFHYTQSLVRIPQCKEDRTPGDLEKYIATLCKGKDNEIFVKYPYQVEAEIISFEDARNVYKITQESSGALKMKKSKQEQSNQEYRTRCTNLKRKLGDLGVALDGEAFTLVNVRSIVGADELKDTVNKFYFKTPISVPLSVCMRRRTKSHYQNLNEKVKSVYGRVNEGDPAICFTPTLLGICGIARRPEKNTIRFDIDREAEERKVQDAFFGFTTLHQGGLQAKAADAKAQRKYYTTEAIEEKLGLQKGVVHKLTSSFSIGYQLNEKEPEDRKERQVVDIGLNIKNFSTKVHIPGFVRFVDDDVPPAEETKKEENKKEKRNDRNNFQQKHFEYSQECVNIIEEYNSRYPEVLIAVAKDLKLKSTHDWGSRTRPPGINGLYDLFPSIAQKDYEAAIKKVENLLSWIKSLTLSSLEFVDLGFDALDKEMIQKLDNQRLHMIENYQPIDIQQNKKQELIPINQVYQEAFPFWNSPHQVDHLDMKKALEYFTLGSRVMNLNSTQRQYIPFGLRGTVIGKTESKILVMFDEQFLGGTSLFGHCGPYYGAQVQPKHLLNLSKQFVNLAKDNFELAQKFKETVFKDQSEFNLDGSNLGQGFQSLREKFLQTKHRNWQIQEESGIDNPEADVNLSEEKDDDEDQIQS